MLVEGGDGRGRVCGIGGAGGRGGRITHLEETCGSPSLLHCLQRRKVELLVAQAETQVEGRASRGCVRGSWHL